MLAGGVVVVLALSLLLYRDLEDIQQTTPTSVTILNNTKSPSTVPSTPTTEKGVPNASTYHSLLTQKGSYECDYSQVQSDGQSNNVIYISDGRLRGEFRKLSGNTSQANLMVYDGHYLYQWAEGQTKGTRTVLSALSQLPLVIPRDLTSGGIYGDSYQSVGWDCHSWIPVKSLLAPPSYVTFS